MTSGLKLTDLFSVFQAEALGQQWLASGPPQNQGFTHLARAGLIPAVNVNHTKKGQWVKPG